MEFIAEAEGFEPPVHCCTTVFKTAAIDHSATPPYCESKGKKFLVNKGIFCNFASHKEQCNFQPHVIY